jgi:hypothetical protein
MCYPKRVGARFAGENDCKGELVCIGVPGATPEGVDIGDVIGECTWNPVEPGLNIGLVIGECI